MAHKTAFRVIAEGLNLKKLDKVSMPVSSDGPRKLTVEEIQNIIKEEMFGDAKSPSDEKAKEAPWADAELANQVDWVKNLKIKEFLKK